MLSDRLHGVFDSVHNMWRPDDVRKFSDVASVAGELYAGDVLLSPLQVLSLVWTKQICLQSIMREQCFCSLPMHVPLC